MGIPERVTELLEPVITQLGAELVDIEWTGGTLRVLVDDPDGDDGRIDTAKLTRVNRAVSPVLDEEDPIPGRYTLEVSSPGIERRLSKPAHYTRAIGEDVVVKLNAGEDPRRVKGRLLAVSDTGFTVEATELDGNKLSESERLELEYEAVNRTKTHFKFGGQPKPHSSTRKKRSAK